MRILVPFVLVLGLAACKGDEKPAATPTPVEKPADKPAEKPADKPAEKPAEKPADKPAEKPPAPADTPADTPADKPADAPADKPADAPADKPADAPADAKGTPYAKDGIAVTVPAGWSVTQDEVDATEGWMRTIHVENEQSGLVVTTCFKDVDITTDEFLKSTLSEMSKVIEPARIEVTPGLTPVTAMIGGVERTGHTGRYKVILSEVEVPHTASAYKTEIGELKCVVLTQASDDEIAGFKAAFETILTTLAAAK